MTKAFTHFIGIDWSGAKGKRHKGIAIAVCAAGSEAPQLVLSPDGRASWSREGVASWITEGCGLAEGARALIGIDSAFSMPFVDQGAYLGKESSSKAATELWQEVNSVCFDAEDLFGGPFVEANASHYHRPNRKGDKFSRRMRVTENLAVSSKAGPCESVFHLIGPSQVGMSGLSTMRMLAVLSKQTKLAIWPYEETEHANAVLVEIYAAAFASLGGHRGKYRSLEDLNLSLSRLETESLDLNTFDDHSADAIITSAGLRKIAHERKYWHPEALSTKVRRTEGWVFGIV